MKTLTALLLLVCSTAFAQYGRDTNPDHYRIVNGKIWSIMESTNWVTLNNHAKPIECDEILKQGILFKYEDWNGDDVYFVLLHYPEEKTITTGSKIYGDKDIFRVMKVGTAQRGSQRLELYDYGLPNTAENRKTLKK